MTPTRDAPPSPPAPAPPPAPPPPVPTPPPAPAADAAVWHYTTPRRGVMGPFTLAQIASFKAHIKSLGHWASLRLFRAGQDEATHGVLASSLLGD